MKWWVRTEDFREKAEGPSIKHRAYLQRSTVDSKMLAAYGVIAENRSGVSPPKTIFREHSIGRV